MGNAIVTFEVHFAGFIDRKAADSFADLLSREYGEFWS